MTYLKQAIEYAPVIINSSVFPQYIISESVYVELQTAAKKYAAIMEAVDPGLISDLLVFSGTTFDDEIDAECDLEEIIHNNKGSVIKLLSAIKENV